VTELAGTRDRVEGPPNAAGAYVVRAHVTRGRTFALSHACSLNEEVLVDDTRTRRDEKRIVDVASKAKAQVDEAGITERRNRTARSGVERVESTAGAEENSLLAPVRPPRHAAIHVRLGCTIRERIEAPEHRPAIGPERDDRECGGGGIEHPVDDDRRRLDLRSGTLGPVAGAIRPRNVQLRNVVTIDFVEWRIACVAGIAARDAPIASRRIGRHAPRPAKQCNAETQHARRFHRITRCVLPKAVRAQVRSSGHARAGRM
jgi:hypothetical protein